MRHLFRAAMAASVLLLGASCGGTTGLELQITTPAELVPGVDFNKIHVQVDAAEGGTTGDFYPVSPTTARPYNVYVFSPKTTHYKVSIRVELFLDATIKKTKLVADQVISQGETVLVPIAIP
jgi:hypothetical protein